MRTQETAIGLPPDFTAEEVEIYRRVQEHTMTSPERVVAAVRAIDHIVANQIGGDVVECGVWLGGSTMAMALALLHRGDPGRTLFLYDTFAGMSPPGDRDIQYDGSPAADLLASSPRESHVWGCAPLGEVQRNLESTGYPPDRIRFVVGRVEETIPGTLPAAIAVLRLDTDWYASTRHELTHLYPLLAERGVLIVDDYGHWRGAKEATDEYFRQSGLRPFLHRIDYTGVLVVKS